MNKSDNSKTSIHVCLVSQQTIANIVPLLLERPGRAILLETEDMRVRADRMASILRPRGIQTERIFIEPYDFGNVEKICDQICRKYDGQAITLNVTGGTKISALAAFETFYSAGNRIIYLNTAGDELLELAPAAGSLPVPNLIDVPTDLQSYGLWLKSGTTGKPSQAVVDRRKATVELSRLLIGQSSDFVSCLNRSLAPYNRRMGSHEYVRFRRNELGGHPGRLRELLVTHNLAVPAIEGGLNINTAEACRYLSGGWLEEYVFHTISGLGMKGMDVRLNVEVQWDRSPKTGPANEFDVLFTHRNRLHIVSCKTGNLDRKTEDGTKGKDALYELDSLADRAGGVYGRAMLVSVRTLSKTTCRRAARMKIKIIDGHQIIDLRSKLIDWIAT